MDSSRSATGIENVESETGIKSHLRLEGESRVSNKCGPVGPLVTGQQEPIAEPLQSHRRWLAHPIKSSQNSDHPARSCWH